MLHTVVAFLQAAAPQVPNNPSATIELLITQLTTAFGTSAFIEWLKSKPWFPFAKTNAATMNRLFALLASLITSIGLHISFDSTAGTLVVTGITAANIIHSGSAWLQQYAMQQLAYKKLVSTQGSNVTIANVAGPVPVVPVQVNQTYTDQSRQ